MTGRRCSWQRRQAAGAYAHAARACSLNGLVPAGVMPGPRSSSSPRASFMPPSGEGPSGRVGSPGVFDGWVWRALQGRCISRQGAALNARLQGIWRGGAPPKSEQVLCLACAAVRVVVPAAGAFQAVHPLPLYLLTLLLKLLPAEVLPTLRGSSIRACGIISQGGGAHERSQAAGPGQFFWPERQHQRPSLPHCLRANCQAAWPRCRC